MLSLNNINRFQSLYAFIYFLFLPILVLSLEIFIGYIDYTLPINRYGLLIFILPLFFLIILSLYSTRIKKINLPTSLLLFIFFLIVGFPLRDPTLREMLNICSFIIPYLGIWILYYNLKDENLTLSLLNKFIKYILSLFFIALILSHLYTFLNFPSSPFYYIWETNFTDKPFKTLSNTGHHLTSFIGTYGIMFLAFLYYSKKMGKKLFYTLTLSLFILVLLSSARIGIISLLTIFPLGILAYKRVINYIMIPISILFLIIMLYYAISNIFVMEYMQYLSLAFQDMTGLNVINPEHISLFSSREKLWTTLFKMISDNPIFGHGHPLPYDNYGHGAIRSVFDLRVGGSMFDAQSESGLILAAKYGVPAFISFSYFIFSPMIYTYHFQVKIFSAMLSTNAFIHFMINGDFIITFNHTIIIIMLFCLLHKYLQLEKKNLILVDT